VAFKEIYMFTRPRLLACSLFFASTTVFAADNVATVIEPVIQRDTVKLDIRSRDLEVGIVGGLVDADGGNSVAAGVRLAYHFHNHWFTEASLVLTKGIVNNDSEPVENMTATNLVIGYSLYQDTYLRSDFRVKSSIYVLAGAGLIRSEGSDFSSVVLGAGYRMMLSENVSVRAEVRSNIYSALEDADGWVLEPQATLGLGYYF
jgi:outer membrane beta-barrel protein